MALNDEKLSLKFLENDFLFDPVFEKGAECFLEYLSIFRTIRKLTSNFQKVFNLWRVLDELVLKDHINMKEWGYQVHFVVLASNIWKWFHFLFDVAFNNFLILLILAPKVNCLVIYAEKF